MLLLYPKGLQQRVRSAPDFMHRRHVQIALRRVVWQVSRLAPGGRWSLLGARWRPAAPIWTTWSGRAEMAGANRSCAESGALHDSDRRRRAGAGLRQRHEWTDRDDTKGRATASMTLTRNPCGAPTNKALRNRTGLSDNL